MSYLNKTGLKPPLIKKSIRHILALLLLAFIVIPFSSSGQKTTFPSVSDRLKMAVDKSKLPKKNAITPSLVNTFTITNANATTNSLASIIQSLVGQGVTVSNITTNLPATSDIYGSFNGGTAAVGIEKGLLITNGSTANAIGPNVSTSATRNNGLPGYPPLDALGTAPGYDASYITFNITPTSNTINFKYAFASEEYNEFVYSQYNDIFAFFISGPGISGTKNIALIPGTNIPVAINNVNKGNVLVPATAAANPQYYVNNTDQTPSIIPQAPDVTRFAELEYDGLTVVINAQVNVIPGSTYTLTLAIEDVGDGNLDSGVFLEGGSISSATSQTITFPPISTKTLGDPPFALAATATSGLPVTYTVLSGPATVSNNIVTPTGVGMVTIQADQAGNTTYAPAQPVTQSFNVVATTISKLIVSPHSTTQPINNTQCFQALVLGQADQPLPNITVTFTVTGVSAAASGFTGVTNANGIVNFCYYNTLAGTDKVKATAGNAKDSGTIVWTPVAVCNIGLTSTSVQPSCFGIYNGAINLTVSGAVPPVVYAWSNGATTEDISGLKAGTYTVKVTDKNNCTASTTVTLTDPPLLKASFSISPNPTVPGQAPATIFIGYGPQTVTIKGVGWGGTGPITFDWGTYGISNSITVSPKQTTVYTCVVKDSKGCVTKICYIKITVIDVRCGGCDDKIMICHKMPGTNKTETWCIPKCDVAQYLKCGDKLGHCGCLQDSRIAEDELYTYEKMDEDKLAPSVDAIDVLPISGVMAYPNPAKGYLDVQWDAKAAQGDVILNVFNTAGKLVMSIKPGNTNIKRLDLSTLTNGLYMLQVFSTGKPILTSKFIVQK